MAFDKNSLIQLAKATAKAYNNPSFNFSYGEEQLSGQALETEFKKEVL